MTVADRWIIEDSAKYAGLTIEEKARKAAEEMGETGQIMKVAWMMEIEKALNAQIEDCAKVIESKAGNWERLMKTNKNFIGTYEEYELMQEMAEAIRALAAPKEAEHDANEYKHSPWRCGCEEKGD